MFLSNAFIHKTKSFGSSNHLLPALNNIAFDYTAFDYTEQNNKKQEKKLKQ